MQIHQQLDLLPAFEKTIITIGSFDGVHRGHLMLIEKMLELGKAKAETPVIITFDPHPQQLLQLRPQPISLLTTTAEKSDLLADTGIEHLVITPFTKAFSEMDPKAYISEFLVKYFKPSTIIIGHDHRFGKERKGDIGLLASLANQYSYEVDQIPAYLMDSISISSTRIRTELMNGHITVANEWLGYAYFFHGNVIRGNQLGRSIGFPTANILPDDNKLIPGNGVYAVMVHLPELGNRMFSGMMNIGIRPTFNGTNRSIEVHIFGIDEDLYDLRIKVSIREKIRDEVRFDSPAALQQQLEKDRRQAFAILGI